MRFTRFSNIYIIFRTQSPFRYGAVVRGQNAYVPPGARSKGGVSFATPPVVSPAEAKPDIPKLSVNGPDGTSVAAAQAPSPPSSKAASPTPAANKARFRYLIQPFIS